MFKSSPGPSSESHTKLAGDHDSKQIRSATQAETPVGQTLNRTHEETQDLPNHLTPAVSSRIAGFYLLSPQQRREQLAMAAHLTNDEVFRGSAEPLSVDTADTLIENVVGTFELPFGIGLNLRVNGIDRLVPMAVEEPSIVAAISRVAKMARHGRGFEADADEAITVAQVHLTDVADPACARAAILAASGELLRLANTRIPGMVRRGGGARRVSARVLTHGESGQTFVVIHIHLDTVDAMGANVADHVAEGIAPLLSKLSGGRVVMRILSNLSDERLARACCRIPFDRLAMGGIDGAEVASRVVEGWRLADCDPYRAVTHNKGVMNGIDAAATALGQDVRAIEAAAHAHAARSGQIRPLSRFDVDPASGELICRIEVPLPVTTVGSLMRVHPKVALAHELIGCNRAKDLACVLAAVGLAQNLSAVQTLVTVGIQRGHMRLHARKERLL